MRRWVVHFSPQLLERFNRRKRSVTGKWHMDEIYGKVRGRWTYLYHAIDSVGDTVAFFLSETVTYRGRSASFVRLLRPTFDVPQELGLL